MKCSRIMPIATLACLIAGLLLSTFARAEVAVFFAGGQSNATARWSKGIEAALKGSGRFDEVLVVHANQGATGMTAWLNDRTENLYDKHFFSSTPGTPGVLQKALGDLAAAGKSYSFQGLFWFQGETDAKNGEQSLWVSRFSSLISSLQNDLGTSHWKYVITAVDVDTSTALGLSRLDGINELRAAMTSFVASTPNALIIDSRGWPRTPVNELYHLTEDDRYALGGQTAGIFLSATAVPEPARSGLFAAALILLISLGIKRNKRGALCALTALCASLSLPDARAWGLRVDIAGHPDGIELSPATGAAANAALQNATWGDPAARKRSLFFQRRDLPDGQSAQLEFTFIPAQSGKVTLRLNGCWAKDPKQAQGVVYEKVEATGGVLMNPDFSDRTGTGSLRYWWFENAALPLARGVKGWHGSSIAQYLTVSEGTAVTIKLVAREAGAQEQAAPLPQAAPPVSFKQGDWKLTIDGATGTWKNLEYKNIPLYQNPSGQPSFILNGENTQGNRILKRHTFDPATGTASIITTNGTWLFEERLAFGKRIKREVLATFSGEGGGGGEEPARFTSLNFLYYLPKEGFYYFPRSLFGDTRHYMQIADTPFISEPMHTGKLAEMKAGASVRGTYNGYFSFVQQTPSRTLMFTFDGRREQASTTTFQLTGNVVRNNISVKAAGWAMPGIPQKIGDAYIEVFDGDVQAALRKAPHAWFRDVGMLPPADTPEWFRDVTSLWCFGPYPFFGGVDGFRGASREMIPYAKARGANLFWLLPINTMGMYSIRDYYQLRAEVGTEAHYKEFLDAAKANGFHVFQDIVPHGQFAEYGLMRGVSPWTISIKENGQFADAHCYDYASKEWRDYIDKVADFYTKNFPIDGFRIDQPSLSPMNWRRPGFPTKAPQISSSRWWEPEDIRKWNDAMAKWWADAVAKNGGQIPPVDGERGSASLAEGGALLAKGIRDTVRQNRRDGATLAETEEISCAPSGDAIYDFYIRRAGLKMPLFDGETTARELARFFDEQRFTEPPGTLRIRFLEVHDSQMQRATNWCGQNAGQALRSALFWSRGIPHLLASTDVGMGAHLQRLNAVRAALPEFRRGEVEYQAIGSTPSVFTALRFMPGRAAIGVTSFLPQNIKTTLNIPVEKLGFKPNDELALHDVWTGKKLAEGKPETFRKLTIDLPAYGNAVLTWRPRSEASPLPPPPPPELSLPAKSSGRAAPVKEQLSLKKNDNEFVIEGARTLVVDRHSGLLKKFGDWVDGSTLLSDKPLPNAPAKVEAKIENGVAIIDASLACGARLRYVLNGPALEISGALTTFSKDERAAFVLSATGVTRWQVNSIEGWLDDFIDKKTIDPDFRGFLPINNQWYRPTWSPILWHSEVKPLNPSSPLVRAFDDRRKGFEIELDAPLSTTCDDMMLLNRLPGKAGLHAAVFWVQPGPLSMANTHAQTPRAFKITIRPAGGKTSASDDAPFVSNGVTLAHESMFWRLENKHHTLRLTRNGGVIKEILDTNGQSVFSGQDIVLDKPAGRISSDFETGIRCFSEDGQLKLRFLSALRNGNNSGLTNLPVWVVTEYALDESDRVRQSWKVYPESLSLTTSSGPIKDFKITYVARQREGGGGEIRIPVLDENGKLGAREFLEFSATLSSASGSFEKGAVKKSKSAALDWTRFFQLHAVGETRPLPLMIASAMPGNALTAFNHTNTVFTEGHRAPAAIKTQMPGIAFLGPVTELAPGKYRLKTHIKGENLKLGRGRAFVLLSGKRFNVPQGSFDWQPFETEMIIPGTEPKPVAFALRISLDAYGEGTLWTDIPQWEKIQ